MMLFIEKESRFSPYIKFEQDSLSADLPKLSVVRVEMERVHPGMSDFIMRVATPKYAIKGKSGTVLSIRGGRSFTKFDTMTTLSETVKENMLKRNDGTHTWESLDVDHLANMLYGPCKYFAANARLEKLSFTTEALS